MRLATRYQRLNLLITVSLFMLASVAFYVVLYRTLIFQVDEDLEIEQHEIQSYLSRFGDFPPNVIPVEDQIVRYEKLTGPAGPEMKRTLVQWDSIDKEKGRFRQLEFSAFAKGAWYQISISKSLSATEGLARSIGIIALTTIALILLISFLINHMVLRKLWKPFYSTIGKMKTFQLNESGMLHLPATTIDEFSLLNKTLQSATQKAAGDYQALKEFTENAAHELQTPLAIIGTKMDLLIQDESLSEQQSQAIQDVYGAIKRMDHLNRSLLLLTKIENGQFEHREPVDIWQLIQEKLSLFDAFIVEKGLTLKTSLEHAYLLINPVLADMLISNLLSNAIHHNYEGGEITIRLREEALLVCNTAIMMELDETSLFKRFYKATPETARTGLGLAIVKQACEAAGCDIRYTKEGGRRHCFSVEWKAARLLQV